MAPAMRADSTRALSRAAVAIRIGILERRLTTTGGGPALASATSIGDLLRPGPESAHAALVGGEGLVEIRSADIRPLRLGTVELGLGRLPEEAIAETHLPRRADDQVRI